MKHWHERALELARDGFRPCDVTHIIENEYGYSKMYNKDQYSLLVNYKGEDYFLNVPTWYGAAVEEDFSESGQTAAEFFDNAYIEEIEEFETKFNNNSFNIKIYEG